MTYFGIESELLPQQALLSFKHELFVSESDAFSICVGISQQQLPETLTLHGLQAVSALCGRCS